MTRVWERLFIGGLEDAVDLAKSNPHGITTVISLCEDEVISKRRGVNYVHLPIDDAQPVSVGEFDRIMDAIAENIRWGIVLLHCGQGVIRAPSLTAAYMHVVGYCNLDSALAEIKRLRPISRPSRVLVDSIGRHLK
jgi:protein-tyrosine phosphatase